MSGRPLVYSALNSQLGLVVQSAEASEAEHECSAPQACNVSPSPAPAVDLEEWLLSDVVWDPFDMVRNPPACACRVARSRVPEPWYRLLAPSGGCRDGRTTRRSRTVVIAAAAAAA